MEILRGVNNSEGVTRILEFRLLQKSHMSPCPVFLKMRFLDTVVPHIVVGLQQA